MGMVKAAALAVLLLVAAWSDARSRRIPNALVLAGMGVAFTTALASAGLHGLVPAFAGLALGLCLLLPAYAAGVLGAGDVKLIAAVGAYVGPGGLVGVLVLTFLAGGVMSLGIALRAHAVAQLARNLRTILVGGLVDVALRKVPESATLIRPVGSLPYAVAIALGTGLWMWFGSAWSGG